MATKTIAHATTTSTSILPVLSGVDLFYNGCERIDRLELSVSFDAEGRCNQVDQHTLTYFFVNIIFRIAKEVS